MASKTDDKTKDAKKEAQAEPAPKKKLGVLIGAATFLVLGAGAAVLAVPKKPEPVPRLEGPFVARLSKEDLQVNLSGENGKRYLVLGLSAEFFAYDQAAVLKQLGSDDSTDLLFTTRLTDTMLQLAARKTREQVEDPVQMEAFLMEVRAAVEPLLFPVCVGDSNAPQARDTESGLRVGESVTESSLRGLLHDHEITLDGERKTIQIDKGAQVKYTGNERDLRLTTPSGEFTFVDVTGVDPEYSGTIPVGVQGRLRRIYRGQVLVQ